MASLERWTIETLREKAGQLGKPFNPNPQIKDRLEADLANPETLVFFNEDEVKSAVEDGKVPRGLQTRLVDTVTARKDIAILSPEALKAYKEWEETQTRAAFLTQKKC